MKRIIAMIQSLILILAFLTGCHTAQTNGMPAKSNTSQSNAIHFTGNEPQNNDDTPDTPTEDPKPPENNEEPLFKYNKYMISADAREYFSEREYSLYCKTIDSILAHDGVVEGFESENEFWNIWGFLLSEFIPVRSIIQTYGVSNEPFTYENGTAIFQFIADAATCKENYDAFENIMNEALSLIKENDSDWERIAKLYLYVSDHMFYGSPYQTYGVNADLYNSIKYKLGMCADYAEYLNLLANQIGFETISARSLGKDGFKGADHAWSMICVDGQWFHFDTCLQAPLLHDTMNYFAFSTQYRYHSLAGSTGEVEMFRQQYYTNERFELPYCENGISEDKRIQLYLSVIDDYRGVMKFSPY